MVSLYWFLCLVTDPRPRYWIYLGITLGIGLEVKYTIAGLIAGIRRPRHPATASPAANEVPLDRQRARPAHLGA